MLTNIPIPDILITMGCGAECPWLPTEHIEDWALVDPSGKPIEEFRVTRDLIKEKILELIERVQTGDLSEK